MRGYKKFRKSANNLIVTIQIYVEIALKQIFDGQIIGRESNKLIPFVGHKHKAGVIGIASRKIINANL